MEQDLPLARVVFDLPRRNVPDLMAVIGGFALDHDIAVDLSNAPLDTLTPSISEDEANKFNHDMVTFFPGEDNKGDIAVVTKKDLDRFSRVTVEAFGSAERLINHIGRHAYLSPNLIDWLYGTHRDYGFSADGIKVEHIRDLQQAFESGGLEVPNVGKKSIGLLTAFCKELFSEE